MDYDLIKDLCALTSIQEKTLRKLVTKVNYCICDATAELSDTGSDIADIDLGFGNLAISIDGDSVVYKFIPSRELEECVRQSILNGQNLLEDALEASLADKLTATYKDIL